MKIEDLGEFGLLKALGLGGGAFPAGWTGPGDDAAVLALEAGTLLFTTDVLLEDVHFRTTTTSARDLGYKSVAVNVSDVAAMGGTPLAFTLTVSLPGETSLEWAGEFLEGVRESAREFGCPLVGGDTTGGPRVFLSVALLGTAGPRGPVYRRGAAPGDDLYVSGSPGESALGLELLRAGRSGEGEGHEALLIRRHRRPQPRVGLGSTLAEEGCASAMIDVSDGLLQDLGHILEASGAGAELRIEDLPLSVPLRAGAPSLGLDAATLALTGGEDYELLFTSSPARRSAVERVSRGCGTPVHRIGTIRSGTGIDLRLEGAPFALSAPSGFEHFRAPS